VSDLFGIINLGVSALVAYRNALDTHSHNLANVDTPGYSRQEAVLTTNPALPQAGSVASLMWGQFGTGVNVETIRRAHEAFLGLQARMLNSALGRWTAGAVPLREVESVLAPAPGEDLSAQLDRFWDTWESVANKPEDLALRYALRQSARTLADSFRNTVERLQSIRLSIDAGIQSRVEEVNTLGREIGELNRQISVALAEGRAPNDLLDRRDLLLDRLALLSGALAFNSEGGHLIIYLDGRPLIQGATGYQLSMTSTDDGMVVRTSYDGGIVQITGGEIGGLLLARDSSIPGYLSQLDTLAQTLVSEVNSRHQAGYGLDDIAGRSFFAPGSGAGDMALDPAVLADVRAIAAASAPGAPGDGSTALGIANLRATPVLGGQTLNQLAQSLLGSIGNDIANSDTQVRAHQAVLHQIRQQQQSAAGVSIDEELANLAFCQRAYEAAARVVTAADEMLAIIIERLGVS